MDVMKEIAQLTLEIYEINNLLSEKMNQRIDWCNKNRREIKKLFPTERRIYEIIDYKNAFPNKYDIRDLEDEVYYFKVSRSSFLPNNDFDSTNGKESFTVKGNILNYNLQMTNQNFEQSVYVKNLKEIETLPEKGSNNFTKVYVMIDKNTGYYKIGRSKNPRIREKTLQSEKPTIEILHVYDAKVKNEKELHDLFSTKRIRGEWFDLNGSDIETIKNFFNYK